MTTTRSEFNAARSNGPVVTVLRSVFVDAVSPVALYEHLTGAKPGTFLLESAEQGGIWSRYSFVGLSSWGCLTENAGATEWIDYGLSAERAFGGAIPSTRLGALDALYERWASPVNTELPPLTSGLVGYLGWDTIRELEKLPDAPPNESGVPAQSMVFVRDLLVLDHRTSIIHVCTAVLNEGDADKEWTEAQERITDIVTSLNTAIPLAPLEPPISAQPDYHTRTEPADFLDAVTASKRYIREGDVFQVVISQRFDAVVTARAVDVYRMLRALNPSPYMYLLALETTAGTTFEVVGSSPEALVKVDNKRVFSHPIAGSRPRGATPELDVELAEGLLTDDKERAEHLMLVDLARNDLSRVCAPGTVEVTEFMTIERFSHIMHLVSSVEGDLAEGQSPIDVFRATFPAGTLSGAPKPRALEIIDELEPASRGVYGGVVGYVGFGGDTDLAIAIRTAVIVGNVATVQAGAGLVADSVPQSEYDETVHKAAAPLRAVASANALTRAID
ncbi:MAG: anthranilate synthase component I [Microbacteriaceae bacterium]